MMFMVVSYLFNLLIMFLNIYFNIVTIWNKVIIIFWLIFLVIFLCNNSFKRYLESIGNYILLAEILIYLRFIPVKLILVQMLLIIRIMLIRFKFWALIKIINNSQWVIIWNWKISMLIFGIKMNKWIFLFKENHWILL